MLGLRSTGASFDIIYLTLQGKIICSSFKAHLYIFIPPSKMAKRFVAHPLLVGHDLPWHENEADLEDHSEELQHEVVDSNEP